VIGKEKVEGRKRPREESSKLELPRKKKKRHDRERPSGEERKNNLLQDRDSPSFPGLGEIEKREGRSS